MKENCKDIEKLKKTEEKYRKIKENIENINRKWIKKVKKNGETEKFNMKSLEKYEIQKE